jgi:peptidoglycan-N-acetylglucosamine deacetylase
MAAIRPHRFLPLASLTLAATLASCTPAWLVQVASSAHPGCTFAVQTEEKAVALTLDDGPDPNTTAALLDLLAEHDARATFFLISSRVPGNEDLVARIVEEGHEIGNHFTRDEPSIALPPNEFERDLLQADSVLGDFGPVRWARPGAGWYSERMVSTIEENGYRCALGSVYPFDAQIASSAHSARTLLRGSRPGAVIILHDADDRGLRSIAALERVLPELRDRGYRVVTLSELVEEESTPEVDEVSLRQSSSSAARSRFGAMRQMWP